MSDEEIIIFAKKLMKEKGIFYRRSLALSNPGLYDALRRRKLLEKLGLRRRIKKMRSWASMSDEELVDLARKRIEENGISTRREFRNIDKGLHEALRLRKLLDRVFADVEQSKQQAFRKQLLLGLSQAADAMQQFGEQR